MQKGSLPEVVHVVWLGSLYVVVVCVIIVTANNDEYPSLYELVLIAISFIFHLEYSSNNFLYLRAKNKSLYYIGISKLYNSYTIKISI